MKFHEALHPLEHDALPKKDFRRIRAKAGLLVNRGHAIAKLGVPQGINEDKRVEFTEELKRFNNALARFRADATGEE